MFIEIETDDVIQGPDLAMDIMKMKTTHHGPLRTGKFFAKSSENEAISLLTFLREKHYDRRNRDRDRDRR